MPEWAHGFTEWFVTAALDGAIGLALGFALIPIGTKLISPLWRLVFKS